MSSPAKRMTNAHAKEVAITPLAHKRIARLAYSYWKRGGVRMVLPKKIGSERKKNSERKRPALMP